MNFLFEQLSLVVKHRDVDDAVRLEPRNVEVYRRSITDLLRHQLDVIHQLIVFVLNRRNDQTHLLLIL